MYSSSSLGLSPWRCRSADAGTSLYSEALGTVAWTASTGAPALSVWRASSQVRGVYMPPRPPFPSPRHHHPFHNFWPEPHPGSCLVVTWLSSFPHFPPPTRRPSTSSAPSSRRRRAARLADADLLPRIGWSADLLPSSHPPPFGPRSVHPPLPVSERRPISTEDALPPARSAMADAPNTNDELYPIAVLIDELKVGLGSPSAAPMARLTSPLPARRCPAPAQRHPPPLDHRPRPGCRAHERRADPFPRRSVAPCFTPRVSS